MKSTLHVELLKRHFLLAEPDDASVDIYRLPCGLVNHRGHYPRAHLCRCQVSPLVHEGALRGENCFSITGPLATLLVEPLLDILTSIVVDNRTLIAEGDVIQSLLLAQLAHVDVLLKLIYLKLTLHVRGGNFLCLDVVCGWGLRKLILLIQVTLGQL